MHPIIHPQVPPYSGNRLRWPAGLTHLPRRAVLCAALATVAALTACGGGDCEDDHKDVGPVDCKAHPERCQ